VAEIEVLEPFSHLLGLVGEKCTLADLEVG